MTPQQRKLSLYILIVNELEINVKSGLESWDNTFGSTVVLFENLAYGISYMD